MKQTISYVAAITLHLLVLYGMKAPEPAVVPVKEEQKYVEITLDDSPPADAAASLPANAAAAPAEAATGPASSNTEAALSSPEAIPAAPSSAEEAAPAAPDASMPSADMTPASPDNPAAPADLAPLAPAPVTGPVVSGGYPGNYYGPGQNGGGSNFGRNPPGNGGATGPNGPAPGLGPNRFPGSGNGFGGGGGRGNGNGGTTPRRPPPTTPTPPRSFNPPPSSPPPPHTPTFIPPHSPQFIGQNNNYYNPGYVLQSTPPPPPPSPIGGPIEMMPATPTEPAHYFQAFVMTNGISWQKAQNYAAEQGGYLAVIKTAEVNDFVFQLITDKKYWKNVVGAWDTDTLGPWLGGTQDDGVKAATAGWSWGNGRSFNYTNWSTNNLDRGGSGPFHLLFYGAGRNKLQSTWGSAPNTGVSSGFVVEYDKDPQARRTDVPRAGRPSAVNPGASQ